MPKLLSGYAGPNFVPPYSMPGKAGANYLILNGDQNGQFSFGLSPSASTHQLNICVPWEGVNPFLQYALINSQSTSVGGVTSYSRNVPMQSPYANIFPNTYAVSVAGRGDGLDDNVTEARLFEDVILTVTFSTLNFGTEGAGAFVEVNYGGSANYVTIPTAVQTFSNGEPIDHDAGKLVGQLAINVTSHMIPSPATFIATANPLKGLVNSDTVVLDGYSYAPGYLLFPTYDLRKSVDSGGIQTATATLAFIQRDIPWNSGIRSDGVVDSITPAPYQTGDLNGLLS